LTANEKEKANMSLFNFFNRGGFTPAPTPPEHPQLATAGVNSINSEVTKEAAALRTAFKLPRVLEPAAVGQILESALFGDLIRQDELFNLMEDTWPRLLKDIKDVKDAVASVPFEVHPYCAKDEEPTPEAIEKAALIENILKQLEPDPATNEVGIHDTFRAMLDAFTRGISVVEIMWGTIDERPFILKDGSQGIRSFKKVPARFYAYPSSGNLQDRLMLAPGGMGLGGQLADFPQRKFLICKCPARSGHPSNTALMRSLAMLWIGSVYGWKWLANYAQLFGIPFRWAEYPNGDTAVKQQVEQMLENMGSAAWGAFPTGTKINIVQAAGTGKDNPQAYLMEIADKAADILILGQTLTTDVGDSGSRALGDVHANIRLEVIQHAAAWLESILNDQLVPFIMAMNYGEIPDDCPTIEFCVETPKNRLDMAQTDKILFGDLGIPVTKKYLYKRFDIPQPQEGEELFEPKQAANPFAGMGATPGQPGQEPKANPDENPDGTQDEPKGTPTEPKDNPSGTQGKPDKGLRFSEEDDPADAKGAGTADSIQARARRKAEIMASTDRVLTDVTGVAAAWLAPVRDVFEALVAKAQDGDVSDAEFMAAVEAARAKMPDMFKQTDVDALATALEREMGAAAFNGAMKGFTKRGTPAKR
jgi:phage gp29-like protein